MFNHLSNPTVLTYINRSSQLIQPEYSYIFNLKLRLQYILLVDTYIQKEGAFQCMLVVLYPF